MNTFIVKKKLESLRTDLLIGDHHNKEILKLVKELKKGNKDAFFNQYIKNNSPVKVSDLSIKPVRDIDMNEIFIDLSYEFDKEVLNLTTDAGYIMKKFDDAIKLLTIILMLPLPYSYLFYLRYYKFMAVEDIARELKISKSTYYRHHDNGIEIICNYYDSGKFIIPRRRFSRKGINKSQE